MYDGTLPVTVWILRDWRGHKQGDVVTLRTKREAVTAKTLPEVFSFQAPQAKPVAVPSATAEEIVETVVRKRGRPPKNADGD